MEREFDKSQTETGETKESTDDDILPKRLFNRSKQKPMSSGIIIFRENAKNALSNKEKKVTHQSLEVLLVHDVTHRRNPWGFPKGSRDRGEKVSGEIETML